LKTEKTVHISGETIAFSDSVPKNQEAQSWNLKRKFEFIVCGTGLSSSVVAARLAVNTVLSQPNYRSAATTAAMKIAALHPITETIKIIDAVLLCGLHSAL
jgi:hypothetical protein